MSVGYLDELSLLTWWQRLRRKRWYWKIRRLREKDLGISERIEREKGKIEKKGEVDGKGEGG